MIAIFVDGTNDHYTRGYNFPIGTTPKKISVSELGVIFGAHPCIWPFLAIPTLEGQLPLILVRFQRNSGESSRPSKNDPEGQRTQSGPELRRNGRFYVRPKSGFWPKNGSYPKKSPKMIFPPLIIWAKALFYIWHRKMYYTSTCRHPRGKLAWPVAMLVTGDKTRKN